MKHNLILIFISAILLFSCKSKEYIEVPVEVETVKTEYITKHDSVYLHDSINTVIEVKGDTVYVNKVKYKTKETFKTDTVLKVDSIPVVTKVYKRVEVNKIHLWQKILMYIGGVGVLVLIGFIINKLKIWKSLF